MEEHRTLGMFLVMPRSHAFYSLLWRTAAATVLCLLTVLTNAPAQIRWVVDPEGSLAWWQVDPHLNHLWATTCPQEPTWRAGEGRSSGWTTDEAVSQYIGRGFANVSDTIHVPLYPRHRVRFICPDAVEGHIVVPDTVRWRGAHGQIVVKAEMIVTGEKMRDDFAQHSVLSVSAHPYIRFTLDSLVDMRREGDTLLGTALGNWELRGETRPVRASVRAYPHAGGIRVLGKFGIPAMALIKDYGVPKRALGLGVVLNIWKTLFVGVDLLVRPEGAAKDR